MELGFDLLVPVLIYYLSLNVFYLYAVEIFPMKLKGWGGGSFDCKYSKPPQVSQMPQFNRENIQQNLTFYAFINLVDFWKK